MLSAPPIPLIGALMWASFLATLRCIPQERENLLFRHKVLIGGFILSWNCRTFESCASTGEPGDDGLDPPCEPTLTDGGVELECDGDGEHGFDWGWYIPVWASIPPHRVKRTPFPRGMVTVPKEFDYETALWGKPPNGPRADLERGVVPDVWDLESYQVRVPTYWVVEWRDRWYEWEAAGAVEWGECGQVLLVIVTTASFLSDAVLSCAFGLVRRSHSAERLNAPAFNIITQCTAPVKCLKNSRFPMS